jgi:CubicO group peptidase (beta-lactamase class C family)
MILLLRTEKNFSHSGFMFRVFVFSTIVLYFTAISGRSQTPSQPGIKPDISSFYHELNRDIDSLLNVYKIPAAAIAIVNRDSVLYLNGLGWAEIQNKIPVNENTLFRIGSITKTFAALGILKLVEEGKVDLQSTVREILPEIELENPWEETNPVRIVHLLEHTAGLNDSHFNDYYLEGDPHIPLLDAFSVSRHNKMIRWKPGEWYSYSSVGYLLAGCVIEKVSGMRFEDYLQQNLMGPLGLSSTVFHLSPELHKQLAQGYQFEYQPSPYWHSYSRPAGSLHSSAANMAKFLQFFLNRGKMGDSQIVPERSINRLETSSTHPAARLDMESGPRLGLGSTRFGGFRWFNHYGSIMGYAAAYSYCPELELGCALLTNRWDIEFETGMMKVWNTLRNFLVRDISVKPDYPPELTVSSEILNSYTGYYKFINPPQQLGAWIDLILNYEKIEIKHDSLYQSGYLFGERKKLIPVTANTFREQQQAEASRAFFRNSDGELAFIDGSSAYLKCSPLLPWIHVSSFFIAWALMFSSLFYAMIWIPVVLYKKFIKKGSISKYLYLRLLPLVAIFTLLVSFTLLGIQTSTSLTSLGQKTFINILFFLSTWIFALSALISLFISIRSLKTRDALVEKIYAILLSLSCVGMTFYWWYWDIIGLKLWSY